MPVIVTGPIQNSIFLILLGTDPCTECGHTTPKNRTLNGASGRDPTLLVETYNAFHERPKHERPRGAAKVIADPATNSLDCRVAKFVVLDLLKEGDVRGFSIVAI